MNASTSAGSAWPEAASLPSSSKGTFRRRSRKSSRSALAGPVSKAITVSPSMKVTLPTPPRFRTASGCGRSEASAR
jgi:hypothetical protein